MQNKKLLFLVGGLAIATFFILSILGVGQMRYILPGGYAGKMDGAGGGGMGYGVPEMMMDRSISSYPIPPYYGDDALSEEQRLIVYSSSHSVVVNNVSDYLNQLRDYVSSVDGVVTSFNLSNYDNMQSGYLQARVPAEKFDEARSRVTNNVKEVFSENVDSYDVTGQVVGSEDRVDSLEQQLAERRAQLAELEEGSSAYVQMQNQITRLEQQLEQARKALESQEENVQYSTLYVSAADSSRYFDGSARPDPITEFRNAIESLGDSLIGIAYLIIWVVVYAVIWLPLVLIVRWIWRKYKK